MIAFVHIYKTAGTTFSTILRRHYGRHHFDHHGFRERMLTAKHLKIIGTFYPGLQSIGGHTVKAYSNLYERGLPLRYYSCLRDPLARSISHVTWYLRWKANDGIFFDDFDQLVRDWSAARVNQNRQCQHLSSGGTFASARRMIETQNMFIMRVEDFDASLLMFREWAGAPDMDLRYHLRNTAADTQERLIGQHRVYLERIRDFRKKLKKDEALRACLREANQEDQALVDWVDAEIWPAQIAAYPGDLEKDLAAFKRYNLENPAPPLRQPLGDLYRNLVFKPLRPLFMPNKDPLDARASRWL
jgi:hypothetical protein